jgi:carboxymethylenebutenolidase
VPDLYRGKSTVEAEEAHHLMTNLNFGDAASQDVRGAVELPQGARRPRSASPASAWAAR